MFTVVDSRTSRTSVENKTGTIIIILMSVPLHSRDNSIKLLQEIIHEFFNCHVVYDELADDVPIPEKVDFIFTNHALAAPIAASLHMLLRGASKANGKGEILCRDLLMCFTCIMTALTGGGALDRFLRSNLRGSNESLSMEVQLFDSVFAELNEVFTVRNRINKLPANMKKLVHRRAEVNGLRNSSLTDVVKLDSLDPAGLKRAVEKMRREKYFTNSGWTLAISGGLLQAERTSWELLAGETTLFLPCLYFAAIILAHNK